MDQHYQILFEASPHPMWVYDLKTFAFLAVNDAAIAGYGYSREEFLSMSIKDIRPPGDVPALEASVASVTKGLDLAGIWRHRKRDGSIIEVEITSHTVEFAGRRAELVLAFDVTASQRAEVELRRSEASLAAAQRIANLGSWELDLTERQRVNRNSLTWSDEVFRIFGYEPGGLEVTSENFFRMVHPDDRERVRQAVAEAIERRRPYDIEHRIVRPDGTERVVHEYSEISS